MIHRASTTVVFVTGFYPMRGSASVSIETRDYVLGLDALGLRVRILEMFDPQRLPRILLPATLGLLALGATPRSRGLALRLARWSIAHEHGVGRILRSLLRRAGFLPGGRGAAGAQRLLAAATTLLRPLFWQPAAVADLWRRVCALGAAPPLSCAEHEHVGIEALRLDDSVDEFAGALACIVDGYDAGLFGSPWLWTVEAQIRRLFPRCAKVRWVTRAVWETTRAPQACVEAWKCFHDVWVPSEFQVQVLREQGVSPAALHKIPEAVDTHVFDGRRPTAPLALPGARRFRFLTVTNFRMKRKALEILIAAFLREFAADEDVSLVVKCTASTDEVQAQLARIAATLGIECAPGRLIPLGGLLAPAQLASLYAAVDAVVLVSRGEGWGRPLAEAMAMGRPAIATRFGGNLEFMDSSRGYLVDCTLTPVPKLDPWGADALGMWAEPSLEHLRATLRCVVADRARAHSIGRAGAAYVREHFGRASVAHRILSRLSALLADGSAPSLTEHRG